MDFGVQSGICLRIKDYIRSRIEKCKICFVANGLTMAYKGFKYATALMWASNHKEKQEYTQQVLSTTWLSASDGHWMEAKSSSAFEPSRPEETVGSSHLFHGCHWKVTDWFSAPVLDRKVVLLQSFPLGAVLFIYFLKSQRNEAVFWSWLAM